MKPNKVKKLLLKEIRSIVQNPKEYCVNPQKDFTRKRKIPLEQLLTTTIGMGSGSLSNELLDAFHYSKSTPTSSAFIQQRAKLKPEAYETIFKGFTKEISSSIKKNMRILAVDGSVIKTPTNPMDEDTYFPSAKGRKHYNLLHLNALYDLEHHIYQDVVIQTPRRQNENRALVEMVEDSPIPLALVIADRGYESYNNMAHIQEKGWKYLIRIKDGKQGIKCNLNLPDTDNFDVEKSLNFTRKRTNEVEKLLKDKENDCYRHVSSGQTFDFLPKENLRNAPVVFYNIRFRIVRFQISEDTYETVLTNLDDKEYPADKLKELYASRWGIETSFRDLKYTVGLLNFHTKTRMCLLQEIYSHMIMYNFTEMITVHIIIQNNSRKYTYQTNFSIAVHMCKIFYRNKTSSSDLEAIIAKNIVPIRPDRHNERKRSKRISRGFLYRIA